MHRPHTKAAKSRQEAGDNAREKVQQYCTRRLACKKCRRLGFLWRLQRTHLRVVCAADRNSLRNYNTEAKVINDVQMVGPEVHPKQKTVPNRSSRIFQEGQAAVLKKPAGWRLKKRTE